MTKRAQSREPSVAVIDIGSNSVRLVVYEALARSLVTVFNEKALCGLGREVQSTGLLAADGGAAGAASPSAAVPRLAGASAAALLLVRLLAVAVFAFFGLLSKLIVGRWYEAAR